MNLEIKNANDVKLGDYILWTDNTIRKITHRAYDSTISKDVIALYSDRLINKISANAMVFVYKKEESKQEKKESTIEEIHTCVKEKTYLKELEPCQCKNKDDVLYYGIECDVFDTRKKHIYIFDVIKRVLNNPPISYSSFLDSHKEFRIYRCSNCRKTWFINPTIYSDGYSEDSLINLINRINNDEFEFQTYLHSVGDKNQFIPDKNVMYYNPINDGKGGFEFVNFLDKLLLNNNRNPRKMGGPYDHIVESHKRYTMPSSTFERLGGTIEIKDKNHVDIMYDIINSAANDEIDKNGRMSKTIKELYNIIPEFHKKPLTEKTEEEIQKMHELEMFATINPDRTDNIMTVDDMLKNCRMFIGSLYDKGKDKYTFEIITPDDETYFI